MLTMLADGLRELLSTPPTLISLDYPLCLQRRQRNLWLHVRPGPEGVLVKFILAGKTAALHLGELRAGDDFVLEFFHQRGEVVAIAGHPDDQVAVFLRVLLGIAERLG